VRRIADAAVALGELARELRGGVRPIAARLDDAISILAAIRDDVGGLHGALGPMSDDLDGLRHAFQGSNEQLERLREAMTPELQGIRAAAEPLHEELGDQRESIDVLDGHLEELGGSLSTRIEELGRALEPLERDISDVRDIVEPLHGGHRARMAGRRAATCPGLGLVRRSGREGRRSQRLRRTSRKRPRAGRAPRHARLGRKYRDIRLCRRGALARLEKTTIWGHGHVDNLGTRDGAARAAGGYCTSMRRRAVFVALACVALGISPSAAQAATTNLTDAFDQSAGGNKDGRFTLSDCPVYESQDADGQRICSAEVPSFDGTPLDVDLTLPDNATLTERRQSHPLMVMLHGFGNDKREWESKDNKGDNADKHNWNSHWFAEQHGYYVLTYTARGFHTDLAENSPPCEDYQPCTPGGTSGGDVQLKDRAFEIRDTQWLASLAAASFGGINRSQVGISGGSYGGGESWTQASQAQWNFPHQRNDKLPILQLQVAVPKYPWTDLAYSLGPNGHPGPVPPKSPGYCDVNPDLEDDACYGSSQGDPENDAGEGNPIGVLKQSYLTYFYTRGLQRSTARLPARIHAWALRLDGGGEPYDVAGEEDPIVKDARQGLTEERSSYYQDEGWKAQRDSRKVAIFSIQGWTDDLFPAVESFRQYKYLKKLDPKWPVSVELADVGHPRAQNLPATWQRLNQQAWQFLQSNIGTSSKKQQTTISSHPTVCENDPSSPNAGQEENDPTQRLTENTPEELSSGKLAVKYAPGATPLMTSFSGAADPNGPASDPITTEASGRVLPRADTCRESAKTPAVGGYTGYSDELESSSTYVGLGSVLVDYELLTGLSAQLDARLWDVTPGGKERKELLITRGTYRFSVPAYDSPRGQIRIPLFGNHYRLRPGHRLRLDLTQVDNPFLRVSTAASTMKFDPEPGEPLATLNLPTRERGTQEIEGEKAEPDDGAGETNGGG
jgi:hypothetical protein